LIRKCFETRLERLILVEGDLSIDGNAALGSVAGLESLVAVGGSLSIGDNDMLGSLTGLEALLNVGESLSIVGNEHLGSLGGLSRLEGVGGLLLVQRNNALVSLDGLESVTSVGQTLRVEENEELTDCACGLAGLITGTPPGFTGAGEGASIRFNRVGGQCTSPDVVLMAPCGPVGIERGPGIAEGFALESVHPNPVQVGAGGVHLEFRLEASARVQIGVSDLLGRTVERILDENLLPGVHELTWNGPGGRGLAAGTYLVWMEAAGARQTHRLAVVR
jgi:hypothetical protein